MLFCYDNEANADDLKNTEILLESLDYSQEAGTWTKELKKLGIRQVSFTTACVLCYHVCVCTCSRAFCQRAHLKICLRLWHHDSMRQKKGVGDQTTAQSFWPFTSHTTFLSCRLSHTLLLSIQRFYMSAWGHLKPIMAPVKVFTKLHVFFESLGRSFFKKHLCEVWSHRFFKFIFFPNERWNIIYRT